MQCIILIYPGIYHDRCVPEDDLPYAQGDLGEDPAPSDELF